MGIFKKLRALERKEKKLQKEAEKSVAATTSDHDQYHSTTSSHAGETPLVVQQMSKEQQDHFYSLVLDRKRYPTIQPPAASLPILQGKLEAREGRYIRKADEKNIQPIVIKGGEFSIHRLPNNV